MSVETFLERLGYLFYAVNPKKTYVENVEEVPDYVVQVIPHFVLLVFLEHWILLYKKKKSLRVNDAFGSVSQGIIMELSNCLVSDNNTHKDHLHMMIVAIFKTGWLYCNIIWIVVRGVQIASYTYIYNNWRLATLPWDSIWTWLICFFATDLAYYWLHRASHEINILWAAHQVHHSSEEYNLSTALRQSVFQNHSVWIFNLPMALAIPPSVFLVHSQFNLLYQFWIHTEAITTLGPLEYVLNTPSHHRVHHGRNRYCIDKNYAGTLIIWDRMFGTFEPESEEVVYGLTHPINTFESFYIQLCHYMHIWRTFWDTKGIKNKLSVIFKGPGWSPGKPWHGNIEDIPDVKAPVEKYDPPSPLWLKIYMFLHFAILLCGYVEMAENKQAIPGVVLWGSVGYEILSMSVLGMLLEGRVYAPGLELLRCSLYLAMDLFFLPHTRLYKSAFRWVIWGLRATFVSSFIFWLQICLRSVTVKIHAKKLEKDE